MKHMSSLKSFFASTFSLSSHLRMSSHTSAPEACVFRDSMIICPLRCSSKVANMHMQVVHSCYTPKETTELCSHAGVAKATMRIEKIFSSAFRAGCLLGFACAVSSAYNYHHGIKKMLPASFAWSAPSSSLRTCSDCVDGCGSMYGKLHGERTHHGK